MVKPVESEVNQAPAEAKNPVKIGRRALIGGGAALAAGVAAVGLPHIEDLGGSVINQGADVVEPARPVKKAAPRPLPAAKAADLNRILLPATERNSTAPVPPTPPPTGEPTPTPTETPYPTQEGTPTLSVAEHFSRLQLIPNETVTVNGVSVNFHKTNDATVIAGFATPDLKQSFAEAIENNASQVRASAASDPENTSLRPYDSVDVVFVKDKGDSPVGVSMSFMRVRDQDDSDSDTACGIVGYARLDNKLILYYGLEADFPTDDAIATRNRDKAIARDPLKFSKNGISPSNSILFSQQEMTLLNQLPVRVR